jgi:hypothetical protein
MLRWAGCTSDKVSTFADAVVHGVEPPLAGFSPNLLHMSVGHPDATLVRPGAASKPAALGVKKSALITRPMSGEAALTVGITVSDPRAPRCFG